MSENNGYSALAERLGYPKSERFHKILKFLMTPVEARMVAALPVPPEDLAKQENLPVEEVKETLDVLYKKGIIVPRNFETREYYRFARTMMNLHDRTESIDGIDVYTESEKKELWFLWWEFVTKEWDPDRMPELKTLKRPPTRIIPAWKAIKDIPGVLPVENMHAIVEEAPLISTVSCSCRKRKEAIGEPCRLSHDMNCIQFARSAEYTESRGHGPILSKEETHKLIEQTEDDGLVHTWPNVGVMSSATLCSCCDDCCIFMLPMKEYEVPWTAYYEKSRFEATDDLEVCDGCQDCVERCQFDAIDMEKIGGHKKMKAVVNPENCMGCGVCVLVCDPGSLTMTIVRPPEHIPAPKDVGFKEHSHA